MFGKVESDCCGQEVLLRAVARLLVAASGGLAPSGDEARNKRKLQQGASLAQV
jgi:hypothetical protein